MPNAADYAAAAEFLERTVYLHLSNAADDDTLLGAVQAFTAVRTTPVDEPVVEAQTPQTPFKITPEGEPVDIPVVDTPAPTPSPQGASLPFKVEA